MKASSTFIIEENMKKGYSEVVIKNVYTNEFVSIIPDSGARIKELQLRNGRKNISILKKIERIDSNNREDIFTNAKLSPFSGRIKDGQYYFNKIKYELELNYQEERNACHGLVYNNKFHFIEKEITENDASCTFRYDYNKDYEGYPFTYSIELIYKLSTKDGLTCTTKIVNLSKSIIPLSDGWHHYFELGTDIDKLKIKIDSAELITLGDRFIPMGESKMFNEFVYAKEIGKKHFDSCFKMNLGNDRIVTQLFSEEKGIILNIWQETGTNKYNYLVVYTPPDRKSIAIEPITSNINAFNNHEGLILLPPLEMYISNIGVYLSK